MWPRPSKRKAAKQNRSEAHPCKVFVGNISYRITRTELVDFFSQFGEVEFAQIVKDHKRGWSRGIGFVTFKNAESVELALNATEDVLILDGRSLRLSRPTKSKRRRAAEIVTGISSDSEAGDGVISEGRDGEASDGVMSGAGGGVRGCERVSGEDVTGEDSGVSITNSLEEHETKPSLPRINSWSPVLNSDTLIHIFSYLYLKDRIRVERVCKRWQAAARLLWKTVKTLHFRDTFKSFSGRYGGLTDDILHSVFKRGCHGLQELDVSASSHHLTDFALDIIGMYCPRLERLDLSGMSVTQASFKPFTQKCCRIKWLRMAGCHQVGEKGLWWALHNWSDLEYLDMTGNRRINGQCFYLLGLPPSPSDHTQSKGQLRTLILKDCSSITDDGIILLTKHTPPGISNIEHVNISHCQLLTGAAIKNVTAHFLLLRELYFAGPNDNVQEVDLIGIGSLKHLEVLVVDRQVAFRDGLLATLGRNCTKLRHLSCQACYDVSDVGLACLSSCTQLAELNFSYCNKVSDHGLRQLNDIGVLERLTVRACQALTDEGLIHLAQRCMQLQELDVCGCMNITNKTLYAFQESLLHMREECRSFSLVLGGTDISGDVAMQFAAATGASISLHDLSIHSLSADYDPFMDIPPLYGTESWESDDEPSNVQSDCLLEAVSFDGFAAKPERSYLMEKAEDFLLADDPAIFSDEFSGGEEWSF